MAATSSLDQIKEDLKKLKQDPEYAQFLPLLDRMQQWLSAEGLGYPAEIYQVLIVIIHQMKADTQKGQALRDVVKQAGTAGYVNTVGEVGKLYQANGDIIQFILGDFGKEVKAKEPNPSIEVPVILLVMNSAEAQDLLSGASLATYSTDFQTDFTALQDLLLTQEQINNWIKRYGAQPEDWKPFIGSQDTIEQLIENMLKQVQEQNGFKMTLAPNFIDIRTLNADRPELRELRSKGCVIINDVISMRHPLIQREFRRSLLDAFPSTIIVRIAPLANALGVYPPLITMGDTFQDLEFFKRRSLDNDLRSTQVYEAPDLFGWFIKMAPSLIPETERAKAGIPGHMYNIGGDRF